MAVGVVTMALIALSLIYPALAIPSRTIDTADGLTKFDRALPVVFQQDDMTIYRVPATVMP